MGFTRKDQEISFMLSRLAIFLVRQVTEAPPMELDIPMTHTFLSFFMEKIFQTSQVFAG